MDFPFYDAPNTATIICCHIIDDGKPILYVSHDEDDGICHVVTMRKEKRKMIIGL